jgi:hypothetical protein
MYDGDLKATQKRALRLAPVTGIEPANQPLERASAKPAWRTPVKCGSYDEIETRTVLLDPTSSKEKRSICRRRSDSGGTTRTCEYSPYEGERDGPLLHPRCNEHEISLVHGRGFELPKPQGGGSKIGSCKLAVRAFKCLNAEIFWHSPRQHIRANLQQLGWAYVGQLEE